MAHYADLHCHSNASDGSDTPTRVVERAAAAGIRVIALTDHDTVAGVREAQAAGARLGVTVIVGTELTCYVGTKEIHMLGYGMDIDNPALLEHCRNFQEVRIARARAIGERLAAAGVPIDMERVVADADGGVVGRPHVARALVEAGHVSDFQEAFDRFLADGKPACVSKMNVDPAQCVAVIRNAGGIAVMAHAGLGPRFDQIAQVLEAGAIGIEVWHSSHDYADVSRLQALAEQYGILKTGGSDCHGTIKNQRPILGQWGLEEAGWRKVEAQLALAAQEYACGREAR